MTPVASVVDTDAVLKTIWLALFAGVGLPVAFSLGMFGSIRAGDARRAVRHAAFGLYATLAVLAGAVTVGGIVLGLSAITEK